MGVVLSTVTYLFGGGVDESAVCPGTGLTIRQKRLITESWDLLGSRKNQKKYGVNLFMALFDAYPYQKDMFPSFKGKTKSHLEVSPIMRAHATTVMYQIGSFVDNLQDVDCLVGLVQKVAKNHIVRGIDLKQFEELKKMFGPFLQDQLGELATDEVVEAWDKLLGVMNSLIKAEAEKMSST